MAPKYEVVRQISGTRNGEDWPAPGGTIDLPEHEAADYAAAGLVRKPEKKTATVQAPESPEPKGNKAVSKGRGRRRSAKAPETATAPTPETTTGGDPTSPDGSQG